MGLRKVRHILRPDLDYVLINPHDFDSEFHSEFKVEQQAAVETANPTETTTASETEPKARKVRKEEVNTDA